MADQGRWFKLWVTAPYDDTLANLSLEDFARWCLFGIYMKTHGTEGTVKLQAPGKAVKDLFRVESFEEVVRIIESFPNCHVQTQVLAAVTGVTGATVTWRNWLKYQGDNSAERVRAFRDRVTPKKRREEIRREIPPLPPKGFEAFWHVYPKKRSKGQAVRAWNKLAPTEQLQATLLAALKRAVTSADWLKDQGRYIPYPATWLAAAGWEDEYQDAPPGAPQKSQAVRELEASLLHGSPQRVAK